MKLFQLRTDLTSYTYPISKIIACLSIVCFSIFRDHFIQLTKRWADIAFSVFCFQVSILSILCFYISVGELFYVYANRKTAKSITVKTVPHSIETVIEVVFKNDIVEIEALSEGKIIKMGACADCEKNGFAFKDKAYYLMDTEYPTIELFQKALVDRFPEGIVPLFKIDGLPPRK